MSPARLRAARRRTTVVAAFAPSDLSGLRGWWKADAITSPPVNGASLTNWTDSSGNSRTATQATSTNKPVYRDTGTFLPNGKPVVEFSSAIPKYLRATVGNFGATTRFIVYRPKTVGTNQALTSSDSGYEAYLDTSGRFLVDIPGVASLNVYPGSSMAASTWYVVAFDSNGSNTHTSYVNGALAGSSTVSGTGTATTMDIGARGYDAGSYAVDGYIAEIVDYSRVLTSTERGQVTSYLGTKYGVTVAGGGGPSSGVNLNFDWDVSETQAFTHAASGWEVGSAHQHARISTPTRFGTGFSERFEIHNNTATDMSGNLRALMAVVNTNDGGVTSGSIVGYPDIYYAWSSYLPTSGAGDANATVTTGFSQTTTPSYEHLWELHERNGSFNSGAHNISEVSNHAVMIRSGQLQYRQRCGTWNWTGTAFTTPSWSTTTPGFTGSNDQIPIPIVKAGGTNATFVMNAWIDIIVHVRFATDSTGLVEVWARQSGQAFTTAANLTINGPTHKVITGDGPTRTSADVDPAYSLSGCYLEVGLYTGGTSWADASNGAHVHIMDELRRYGTLAEAKANWG